MLIVNNRITRKSISILLILTLIISGFFISPNAANALTVEKMVTKYHLDIGVQQVWGTEDQYGNIIWDEGIAPGGSMTVDTSITFPQQVYNVTAYQYSSAKFKWGDTAHYSSNIGSEAYYNDNYKQFASRNITITNVSSSGKSATFSHVAELNSSKEYDLTEKLNWGLINDVFRLMAGPNSENPEADVKATFPDLYTKLNAGRNGVDPKVHAYMYFTPVIIQYDVKEIVEIEGFEPDITLPAIAKTDESYDVADNSRVDEGTTVKEGTLIKEKPDGTKEIVAVWSGQGIPGKHTGGVLSQSEDTEGTYKYYYNLISEGGEEKQVIKSINVTDGREISGQAVLEVNPQVTHETHPVDAYDESTFDVDGESYSAKRAYEENIASNSFKTSSGTVKKDGDTAAILTYPKKGTYPVTLTVKLKSTGATLTDTKNVKVLKTPYVYDSLGGFQKQNRKQVLTFRIATTKDKPIVDYDIRIKDLKANELINLTKDAPQENGAVIKTRTVKSEVQNEYWTTLTVEFLTKYPRYSLTGEASQKFSYKIKVTDSKGDTDEAYKEFEVAPDIPPIPAISMQTTFLRNEKTNTANIEASDASSSDGDQLQRTWSVANHSPLTGLATGQANLLATIPIGSFVNATLLDGYENLAFGTNQTIGWNKEGVGKTTVKLHVKELWIEPTLEEYITPSDYLEAEIAEQTNVINIAPKVSIEPLETLQANIMIMVSKNKLADLKTRTNELQASLIEAGIDGKVSLVTVYPETKQDEEYKIAGRLYNKSSINCKTCNSVYGLSDSDYIFSAIPMKINADSRGYTECSDIHTLIAHDGTTGKEVWRYTVQNKCTVSLDDKGKYVYLIEEDKTTLLNHDNGQHIIEIPVSIPLKPFISNDDKRLYFADETGIRKLDLETGNMSQLCSLDINLAKLQNGMLTFIAHESQKQFLYGQLDTESEQISTYKYPVLQLEPFKEYGGMYITDYDCGVIKPTDFDAQGNATFLTYGGEDQMCVCWYANLKAGIQKILNMQTISDDDRVMQVGLIKDKVDVGKYAYMQYVEYDSARNRQKGYANIYILEIDGNKAWEDGKHSVFNKKYENGSHISPIIYARYHENNNKVYMLKGTTFGEYDKYRDGILVTTTPANWSSDIDIGIRGTMFDANLETGAYNENYFVGGFWYNSFPSDSKTITAHTYNMTADQKIEYALYKRGLLGNEGQRYIASYGVDVNNYGKIDTFTEENQVTNLGKVDIITGIAEQIKELGKQSVEKLKMKGDHTSTATVLKKVRITPNTTYEYSYDMIQNTNRMEGLTIAEVDSYGNAIKTKEGALYKKVVEKQDFRLPPKSSFATYEGGAIREEGYGDTGYKRDAWGDFNVSFNMEEDGYMEFTLYREGTINDGTWYSGWYYAISDNGTILEKENHNVDYEKRSVFLKKGKHTINFHTHNKGKVGYNSNTVIAIKDIEIGYMTNEQNNSVSNSIANSKTKVLQNVTGTLKSSKDTAMVEGSNFELPYTGAWGIGGAISFLGVRERDPISYLNNQNTWLQINATSTHRKSNGDITFTAPNNKILIVTFNESNTANIRWDGTGKSVGQNKFIMLPNEYIRKQYSRSNAWINGPKLYDFKAMLIPMGSYGITGEEMFCFKDSSINRNTSFEKNNNDLVQIEEINTGKWMFTRYTDIGKSNSDSYLSLSTGGKEIDAYISNFVLKAVDIKDKIIEYVTTETFNKANALQNWKVKLTGNAEAKIELVEPAEKEEDAPLIYKKGQLVAYNINYSDYENDPSKSSYWLYAHTPYNDGEHPDGAIIYDEDGNIKSVCGQAITAGGITIDEALDIAKSRGVKTLAAPIDRFYVDGKYTVYHWEYDNTSRGIVAGGYPNYDRVSNTAELTFYVEGGASAPWITGISTSPAKVTENKYFSINIGIDDAEKDVLNLTTEVYKDRKLIYTHRKKNILPIDAAGKSTTDAAIAVGYPVTNTGALPGKAEVGTYEVVATVRDQTGAGLGTYKFIVISEGKITGYVNHTDKWNENRKKYNLSWFDDEINKAYLYADYLALSEPRKRGTNVFWSGEKFMLRAAVAGSPTKVTCNINGTSYSTNMISSGTKNAEGETIYTGSLWDKNMINKWGMKEPEQLTFTFTANYSGGSVKTHKATVLVDNMNPYWKLHRAF